MARPGSPTAPRLSGTCLVMAMGLLGLTSGCGGGSTPTAKPTSGVAPTPVTSDSSPSSPSSATTEPAVAQGRKVVVKPFSIRCPDDTWAYGGKFGQTFAQSCRQSGRLVQLVVVPTVPVSNASLLKGTQKELGFDDSNVATPVTYLGTTFLHLHGLSAKTAPYTQDMYTAYVAVKDIPYLVTVELQSRAKPTQAEADAILLPVMASLVTVG